MLGLGPGEPEVKEVSSTVVQVLSTAFWESLLQTLVQRCS